MGLTDRLREWARGIKRDGLALWFAMRHPHTPWPVKALGWFVVAYALSPIDLIPDFIPVLGYLDDVILLPVLILLTIKLLPADAIAECRAQADQRVAAGDGQPRSFVGAVSVVLVWVAALALAAWLWVRRSG